VAGETELAAAIAALLRLHGIAAAPGRAEKLAAALAPMLARSAGDDEEAAPDYAAVVEALRWRP
jgi:hypothetical protein